MGTDDSLIQMVRQAQLGDQGSMDWLAETARQRLYAYIYRLTLNHDLAQDLLQQTLLKMVERIKDLEHPERFWCWLFRTALGNVQHHYRTCAKERGIEFSQLSRERLSGYLAGQYEDELNRAARKELYEAVVDTMARLRLSYRNVLMLRCYEQMSYAEIAETMGCKELRARVLFFRAKRSLGRQLTRRGIGESLLVAALGLFGLLTAPADSASAGTVTAASLNVGPVATLVGIAGSPSGVAVAVTVAGATLTLTMEHVVYLIVFVSIGLLSLIVGLYIE